jgi:pectate lyase
MAFPLLRSLRWLSSGLILCVGVGCGGSKIKPGLLDAAGGLDTPDAARDVDAVVATDPVAVTGPVGGTPECVLPDYLAAQPGPLGWATCTSATACAPGTITGGGAAAPVMVSTLPELIAALAATGPKVVVVKGTIAMNAAAGQVVAVTSDTTLLGCGAASLPATNQGHLVGSLRLSGATNVVVRNLLIEGYNCQDKGSLTYLTGAFAGQPDCQHGLDAVSVMNGARNVWFDHVAVFNGSDGNLDITAKSDFVTVSYSKFYYDAARTDYTDQDTPDSGSFEATGHRFSNLVGGSDTASDTGTLNVTWHHNWWGENVLQRQPRVRFGKNHLFNNLFTSAGSSYCVGVGVFANLRVENNVFGAGVNKAINTSSYANSSSILESSGNLPTMYNLAFPVGATAFTPPYPFTLEDAAVVEAAVMAAAGPR